ncbi:hypothetical protein T492DRAFT_48229 [Pavlovales sp. CCMP2436]|nr:hypothetical protein T492DRAFT_48229 [Pavlovales sp. CCMP2436]
MLRWGSDSSCAIPQLDEGCTALTVVGTLDELSEGDTISLQPMKGDAPPSLPRPGAGPGARVVVLRAVRSGDDDSESAVDTDDVKFFAQRTREEARADAMLRAKTDSRHIDLCHLPNDNNDTSKPPEKKGKKDTIDDDSDEDICELGGCGEGLGPKARQHDDYRRRQ